MVLIQIAITAAIVHFISHIRVRAALSNPLAILAKGPSAIPIWTMRLSFVSFWTAVVLGLAGVWSL